MERMGQGKHVSFGVMVCMVSMVFMVQRYRASPGSGPTLLRSIDPDDFWNVNLNMNPIHHPKEDLYPPPPCKEISIVAEGLFLVIPWEVVESIDRATIRLAERITSPSAPKPRPLGPFGHLATC